MGKLMILLELSAAELKELRQQEGSHAEKLGSVVHSSLLTILVS